ncbi:MAG: hypothetical protein AB8B86_18610 [Pseudomonadales bacterium]
MNRQSMVMGLPLTLALTLAGFGLTAAPAQAHDDRSSLRISVHAGGHHKSGQHDTRYNNYRYNDYGHYSYGHKGYDKKRHRNKHASKQRLAYDRHHRAVKRYKHGHRKHRHTSYCPEYVYRDRHHRPARHVVQALRHLDYYAHRNHH